VVESPSLPGSIATQSTFYQFKDHHYQEIQPRYLKLSLFSVAYLVRMGMLLLVAIVLGFIACRGGFIRADKRLWLISFAVFSMTVVSYPIFRWIYFHELLPNT